MLSDKEENEGNSRIDSIINRISMKNGSVLEGLEEGEEKDEIENIIKNLIGILSGIQDKGKSFNSVDDKYLSKQQDNCEKYSIISLRRGYFIVFEKLNKLLKK